MIFYKNHKFLLHHYALPHSYLALLRHPILAASVRSLREHMINGVASTANPFKHISALYKI